MGRWIRCRASWWWRTRRRWWRRSSTCSKPFAGQRSWPQEESRERAPIPERSPVPLAIPARARGSRRRRGRSDRLLPRRAPRADARAVALVPDRHGPLHPRLQRVRPVHPGTRGRPDPRRRGRGRGGRAGRRAPAEGLRGRRPLPGPRDLLHPGLLGGRGGDDPRAHAGALSRLPGGCLGGGLRLHGGRRGELRGLHVPARPAHGGGASRPLGLAAARPGRAPAARASAHPGPQAAGFADRPDPLDRAAGGRRE